MLVSYPAVIRKGQIQLRKPVEFPEGTEVLVVVASDLTDKHKAFNDYIALAEQTDLANDSNDVTDHELVDLVHEVRAEQMK